MALIILYYMSSHFLVIHSDGAYHVIVDQKPFISGHLLEDLTPPIIQSKEIDDPEDKMPEGWDEREM